MTQPSDVISHLHMPMVMLQQQTIMPFIIMQQLHMPPASMLHRFCIMLQAILSVQVHVTFMPPAHLSNFMVQRGTIIMFMPAGMPGVIPVPMPVPPIMPVIIAVRSIIIVPVIERSLSFRSIGHDARIPVLSSLAANARRYDTGPIGRYNWILRQKLKSHATLLTVNDR
jgi:hypothetical protein